MKILIVSDNVSMKMGGEASLPFYYFKLFRQRNIEVYCICHERVKSELKECFSPEDFARFTFISETKLQSFIYKFSKNFPPRINFILSQGISMNSMSRARAIIKQLIKNSGVQLVFEPAPITPKGLSHMYGLGAPVVIGPMCGGLTFPPAFADMDSKSTRLIFGITRILSNLAHKLVRGKLDADVLVVANKRTENALPSGTKGKIYHVAESGVDLDIWGSRPPLNRNPTDPIRFVYAGRFVDWKGVELLVEAFVRVAKNIDAVLELIGGGELDGAIKEQVSKAGALDKVNFRGWLSREESSKIIAECDVFVMPSLRECGGTAILEAMAIGLPTIVTNWCGPAQYVTPDCGILVDPSSREGFIQGLAEAMTKLTNSPELRHQMGEAGRKRVLTEYFDWNSKADRMIEIFNETISESK